MDLISVIVSVYNCEEYLSQCIESIINQTYENIEIILLNDGSTDKSIDICRKYEKQDERIKFINFEENVGSSINKNFALENMNGKYLIFVDNDDLIHKDMIKDMYNIAKEYDACITACNYINIYNKDDINDNINFVDFEFNKENLMMKKEDTEKDNNCDVNIISFEDSIKTMYSKDGVGVVLWNKLYKKEVFDDIRFPEKKMHGDEFVTYKLLDKAKIIVKTNTVLYYYRQRVGSVMHTSFSIKRFDPLDAFIEKYYYFLNKGNDELTLIALNNLRSYILFLIKYTEKTNEDFKNEKLPLLYFLLKYFSRA